MKKLLGGNTDAYWRTAFDERARHHCTVRDMPLELKNGQPRIGLVVGKEEASSSPSRSGPDGPSGRGERS